MLAAAVVKVRQDDAEEPFHSLHKREEGHTQFDDDDC